MSKILQVMRECTRAQAACVKRADAAKRSDRVQDILSHCRVKLSLRRRALAHTVFINQ
jgi:hypothetical protein